jgi:hypothetical protein
MSCRGVDDAVSIVGLAVLDAAVDLSHEYSASVDFCVVAVL